MMGLLSTELLTAGLGEFRLGSDLIKRRTRGVRFFRGEAAALSKLDEAPMPESLTQMQQVVVNKTE